MLEKDEIRSHYRWLEGASARELREREAMYTEVLGVLPRGSEEWRDGYYLLRTTREEISGRDFIHRMEAARQRVVR